jgi:hypothetical protein
MLSFRRFADGRGLSRKFVFWAYGRVATHTGIYWNILEYT